MNTKRPLEYNYGPIIKSKRAASNKKRPLLYSYGSIDNIDTSTIMDGESPLQYDYVHRDITAKLMNDEKEIEGSAPVEKKRTVRAGKLTNAERLIFIKAFGIGANIVLGLSSVAYLIYELKKLEKLQSNDMSTHKLSYWNLMKQKRFIIPALFVIYKAIFAYLWTIRTKPIKPYVTKGIACLLTFGAGFEAGFVTFVWWHRNKQDELHLGHCWLFFGLILNIVSVALYNPLP